jgi:hypothetical protein
VTPPREGARPCVWAVARAMCLSRRARRLRCGRSVIVNIGRSRCASLTLHSRQKRTSAREAVSHPARARRCGPERARHPPRHEFGSGAVSPVGNASPHRAGRAIACIQNHMDVTAAYSCKRTRSADLPGAGSSGDTVADGRDRQVVRRDEAPPEDAVRLRFAGPRRRCEEPP